MTDLPDEGVTIQAIEIVRLFENSKVASLYAHNYSTKHLMLLVKFGCLMQKLFQILTMTFWIMQILQKGLYNIVLIYHTLTRWGNIEHKQWKPFWNFSRLFKSSENNFSDEDPKCACSRPKSAKSSVDSDFVWLHVPGTSSGIVNFRQREGEIFHNFSKIMRKNLLR